MVFLQSRILLVLLLAFSGLNLIHSDCGAEVDRLSAGFCDNRKLRRIDDTKYGTGTTRRFRGLERSGL